MPFGGTEVAILGGDVHDESFHQIDKDVSTSDHLLISSSEIPTDDMSTDISVLERTIAEFGTNLKETKVELRRTSIETKKTKLEIEFLEEEYARQVKNQEKLQAKQDALLAEYDNTYEEELKQQISSTEQKITGIQHSWKLTDDAMRTIQINIESCNDLLNYLKHISKALEQLKNIKIPTEEEQLNNLINAHEALNALENLLNALEKLLSISEAENLRPVLESGRSVQTELTQISTLGKSVPEILTQAKQSTSNISDTEILEAQIATLKHGKLYSPLSSFIENLQTIVDNRVKFATFMQSMSEEQESILEDLTEKLTDFQKCSIIPKNVELSDELLQLERDLIDLKEQLKFLNTSKIKTGCELDNLNLDLNNQHSTINSLESKIKKLIELKRQAEKELERLENSQVSSSPITPSTRAAEIDEPEIDLYTEEQFTSYDEAIEQLPDIDELMKKLRNFTTTKDKQTDNRVSDFHKIAKNCAAIRQFLEEYNNCEIKIREARQKITELERETIVTTQAAELYKQARIDEARLQEEAEKLEAERIKAAVIKIAEGKTTQAREAERSKTDEIITELYKKPRLQEKGAKMLRAKEQMLEQEVKSRRLEKKRLEDESNKINQELWKLFSTNEDLENMNFILHRIKREHSSNSENPYELDRNLVIHSQTLSQMKILVDYLEERRRQQAIAEEAERLAIIEGIEIQGGMVQQAVLVEEEVQQAAVEEHV